MALSTDYVKAQVKGISKLIDEGATEKILKYKDARIFNFDQTAEWEEIFTTTESMTGSKELTENETPPVLTLEEGYQVQLPAKRFGGGISISETMRVMAGDNTIKMRKMIQRQARKILVDNYNLFLKNSYALLNNAFNTGASTLAPDGAPLCAEHHWNTTGAQTWNNSFTDEFSEDAWDKVQAYGGAFTDAAGIKMPIDFDTIVVKKGSITAKKAKKLFSNGISPTKVGDVNIYEGSVTVVETPYIESATAWFAIDSSLDNPLYVGILEFPKMRKPHDHDNESVVSNCTGFYKVGITEMPFAIFGSKGDNS